MARADRVERLRSGRPAAAEVQALRARLQARGLKAADLNLAIPANPTGRTRQQVAAALIAWLKTRPKA